MPPALAVRLLLGPRLLSLQRASFQKALKWRGGLPVGSFRVWNFSHFPWIIRRRPRGHISPVSYSTVVYTVGHQPLVGCEINLVVYSQHREMKTGALVLTKSIRMPPTGQLPVCVCTYTRAYIVPGTCMGGDVKFICFCFKKKNKTKQQT